MGITDGFIDCDGVRLGWLDGKDEGLIVIVGDVETVGRDDIEGENEGLKDVEGKLLGLKDEEGKAVGRIDCH